MMKKIDFRLRILSVFFILHLALSSLLAGHWFFDLPNHFRPLEIVILIICIEWIIFRQSWKKAIAINGLAAILISGIQICYHFIGNDPTKFQSEVFSRLEAKLQIISFNVLTSNNRHQDVVQWIEAKISPDKNNIVFLMETNADWVKSLRSLKTKLPYSIELPSEDNFGLVLLSDTPLDGVRETYFDDAQLSAVSGHIMNGQIRIFGVHPLPPVGEKGFYARNQYFQNLRKRIDEEKMPTLVFGDLNCSPWSANLSEVLVSRRDTTELNLVDTHNGLFRPHTWRAFGGLLSVPIDYILYTPHLVLKSSEIGPDLGSDHLPLVSIF